MIVFNFTLKSRRQLHFAHFYCAVLNGVEGMNYDEVLCDGIFLFSMLVSLIACLKNYFLNFVLMSVENWSKLL